VSERPLPGLRVAAIISAAASAINDLHRDAEGRERRRLQRIGSDEVLARRALDDLSELVKRYCGLPDRPTLESAIETIRGGLTGRASGWISSEMETWLTPKGRGRPKRLDHERVAAIVLSLHDQDGWTVSAAAREAAELMDQVWTNDSRSRAVGIGNALWGPSYSVEKDDREARVARLTELLRQRVEERKSAKRSRVSE